MAINPYDDLVEELDQQPATQAQPPNPYDALIKTQDQERQQTMRTAVTQAQDTAPDRAAEAMRISQASGIPAEVVSRNFDTIKKRQAVDSVPYDRMIAETPHLAKWMEEPKNVAVAHDDLANLGTLEWMVTAPGREFARSIDMMRVAKLRSASLFRSLTQEEQDLLNASKFQMQQGTTNAPWFQQPVFGLASQLPIMFGATLAGAEKGIYAGTAAGLAGLAMGPAAPLSVLGMASGGFTAGMIEGAGEFGFQLESGLALDEMLDFKDELGRTIDPDAAKASAFMVGALNAGLEATGVGIALEPILGRLKGKVASAAVKAALRSPTVRSALATMVKEYGGTLAGETAVEVTQRAFTIAGEELAKFATDPEITRRTGPEVAADLTQEGLGAVAGFSLMLLPGPTFGVAHDMRQAQRAQQNETWFKALGGNVTASKTAERMPQAVQDLLAKATKDGPLEHLYAPVDTFTTYWQSKGLDPKEVATELTGDATAYDEAIRTGADLSIPTASYAVKLAGTEHNDFFAQELRLGPDEMNARESKSYLDAVKAAETEAATAETAPTGVREAVLQRLQAALAGTQVKLPAGAMEAYADVYESAWQGALEREGIDPATLLNRFGIEGPGQRGTGTPAASPTTPPVAPATGPVTAGGNEATLNQDESQATTQILDIIEGLRGQAPAEGERRKTALATVTPESVAAARATSYTPEAQRAQMLALAADPAAVAGARQLMLRKGDIDAARKGAQVPAAEGATAQPAAEPVSGAPAASAAPAPSPRAQAEEVLNREFPPGSPERQALVDAAGTVSPDEFKTLLQAVIQPAADTSTLHAVGDGFVWGRYEPTLPADTTEADFLSWSETVSQQSPKVQAALLELGFAPMRGNDPKGSEVYDAIAAGDPLAPQQASQRLASLGLAGVRYVDGGRANYIAVAGAGTELWQGPKDPPLGYSAIAAHLTPEEQVALKSNTAKRLVELFRELPALTDFTETAQAGVAKRGWYRRSALAILDVFGPVDGPRFAALLAALSPQNSVEQNLLNTSRMWTNWVKAGRPTSRKAIITIMAKSVQGKKGAESVLYSWINNSVRALTAFDPTAAVLSGPKVHSFYRNLIGEVHYVTNDAWMANFGGIQQALFGGGINKAGTSPGWVPGYLAMTAKVRQAAKKITAETGELWTPDQVQETIWSWSKTLYEMSLDTGESAVALLKSGRLTDAAIASTPDFQTLFTNDQTVRSIFEAAGYGKAIDVIERELGAGARTEPGGGTGLAAGSGGAAGAAGRAPSLGLLRSARRLDALRQQRQADKAAKAEEELYQGPLEQSALESPVFYSRLVRSVEQSKQTKATGAQWVATIKNSPLGINQDEFALTSVGDLEPTKSYTKQEVLDYLGAHQVVLTDTVLGEISEAEKKARARWIDDRANQLYDAEIDSRIDDADVEDYYTPADPQTEEEELEDGTFVYYAVVDGERVDDRQYGDDADAERAARDAADEQDERARDEAQDSIRDAVAQDVSFSDFEDEAEKEYDDDHGTLKTFYGEYVEPGANEATYREAFVQAPGIALPAHLVEAAHEAKSAAAEAFHDTQVAMDAFEDGLRADHLDIAEIRARDNDDPLKVEYWRLRAARTGARERLDAAQRRYAKASQPTWDDGHDDYGGIENPVVRVRFDTRYGSPLAVHEDEQARIAIAEERVLELRNDPRSIDPITGLRIVPDLMRVRLTRNEEVPAGALAWYQELRAAEAEAQEARNTAGTSLKVLFLEEVQPPQPESFEVMPELLQKNWREIGFKWALRYAVEHEFDAVAWTTGAQQAARYSLAKVVSGIEWRTPTNEEAKDAGPLGRAVMLAVHRGSPMRVMVDKDGTVVHSPGAAANWVGEKLERVVGKEIAGRVFDKIEGSLDTEDLTIGGEGLSRLYDVDFRNVVNALPVVKKNKGRVEPMSIGSIRAPKFDIHQVTKVDTSYAVVVAERSLHGAVPIGAPLFISASRPEAVLALDRFRAQAIQDQVDTNQTGFMLMPQETNARISFQVQGNGRIYGDFETKEAAHAKRAELVEKYAPAQPAILINEGIKAAVAGGQQLFQGPAVDVTASPEFKAWFGESKVVNKDGSPMLVYHGGSFDASSGDAVFVGTGAGVHFGTKGAALDRIGGKVVDSGIKSVTTFQDPDGTWGYESDYGDSADETFATEAEALAAGQEFARQEANANGEIAPEDAVLTPAYLSIQNPVRMTDVHFDEYGTMAENLVSRGVLKRSELPVAYNDRFIDDAEQNAQAVHDLVAVLRAKGYDGIVYKNHVEDRGKDSWIVFSSTQVKSPENVGAFDPNNPSILQQEKRGSIKWGPDRQFTISLFENADASTFMHESAHLFLELMSEFVQRPEASQQIVQDWATLNDWFFGAGNTGAIGTAQHEQFARAFEQYLAEGKAPSLQLQGAFNRFRAWLLRLYRSLAKLDVQLTDDVRRVFDRMLASDQAIADAEAQVVTTPMFTTAESAGMSDQEFALYRATVQEASQKARETLERRLLVQVQREQRIAYRQQKDDTREKVQQELEARPIYQALFAIRNGTKPNGDLLVDSEGNPIVDGESLKLSREIIVQNYGGEARLATLPRPYVYSAEGGLNPAVLAQAYGFSSGDALLNAIAATPPLQKAVTAETERRMAEQYPDPLVDGTLNDRARAAVANDNRDEVIRAELRALGQLRRTAAPFVEQARATQAADARERAYERRWFEAEAKLRVAIAEGRKQVEIDALKGEVQNLRQKARGAQSQLKAAIPSREVLEGLARDRVNRSLIRSLKPNRFWSAARRASARAAELLAKGDISGAITAKQEELLNQALFREASKALEQVDARVKFAKSLSQPRARQRLGQAGESYLDQVDGLLDRFEFAEVSQKALDRRASLLKWVAALEGQHQPVDLPDSVLEEAWRKNYQELTIGELADVTDALQHILHLARLKNKLLKSQRAREFKDVVTTLAASIRANKSGKLRSTIETRLPAEASLRAIEAFFAVHRKMANLAREMDGFEDGGAMWTAIIQPMNAAGDLEAARYAKATAALHTIFETYKGADRSALYHKVHVPTIGRSLTKMSRLLVALNWGNEENRAAIMAGYKWNESQVADILNTLDARDWKFVQAVWDHLESYWPEIEAKEKRVKGLAPEKVQATPVTTRFGTFTGGYFPLKYDNRQSAKAAAHLDLEGANLSRAAASSSPTTRRGHTKERVGSGGLPVRLDFGVIFEHVQQVIHDLTHHEMLIDAGRIMGSADVQEAIYETYGDIVYRQFESGLRDVAFGQTGAQEGFEKAMAHLRSGAAIAGLAWNLTTAILQPIGLTQSMVRIGPVWVGKGLVHWLRDAASMENSVAWINERSTFMKLRGQTQQREIAEIRNAVGVNAGRLSGWVDDVLSTVTLDTVSRQGMADSYFFLIQQMQRVADVPTWLGQYEKSMAAGETEERAAQIADQAVLDAQGGGQTKDLASVQRGSAMLKLWTTFYSFFSTTYNNAVDQNKKRTRKPSPGQIGRLGVDYLLLYIVPATLGYMVRQAMRPGEDDDDELLPRLFRENLAYLMGSMLGFRELAGAAQGYQGYEGPAGARAFSSLAKLVKQAEQGETDAAFWRALNEAGGILFHYPSGQVRRTIEGAAALSEGTTNNPAALVAGAPKK